MGDTANETRDWSENYEAGTAKSLNIKSLKYKFRYCPAGTFMMGSPEDEEGRRDNETQREVTLTNGFWMLETEVTQAMWESAMGENPSWFSSDMGKVLKARVADAGKLNRDGLAAIAVSALKARGVEVGELSEDALADFAVLAASTLEVSDIDTSNFPVEMVSWEDCQKFIEKLNADGYAPKGWKFRLPSEAEWEYACRAGTRTPYSWGTELNGDEANCDGRYPYGTSTKGKCLDRPTEVGGYASNAWGLFDMHGNVFEWCSDWYGACDALDRTDPTGPPKGSFRVLRGGSWRHGAKSCRSACRCDGAPAHRSYCNGVRIALGREL